MDFMPWQVWDRKWLWAWRWCWLAAPRRRWSWQALFPAPSFSGNWLLASLWGWTGMFTFACLEMSYFAHNPPFQNILLSSHANIPVRSSNPCKLNPPLLLLPLLVTLPGCDELKMMTNQNHSNSFQNWRCLCISISAALAAFYARWRHYAVRTYVQ